MSPTAPSMHGDGGSKFSSYLLPRPMLDGKLSIQGWQESGAGSCQHWGWHRSEPQSRQRGWEDADGHGLGAGGPILLRQWVG